MVKALIFFFLFTSTAFAEARLYFGKFLGHLHKAADKSSTSLTIVQCSHSVKIFEKKGIPRGWKFAMVGDDKGYIESKFLTDKKPNCFQAQYPRFYNGLELDITEMYFWGKLYDHYVEGTSKIK